MNSKRKWPWIVLAGALAVAGFYGSGAAAGDGRVMGADRILLAQADTGYLENVTFEKMKGKERIVLAVSRQPMLVVENQGATDVLVKLENTFVPESLRKTVVAGDSSANLLRVEPAAQQSGGKQWTYVTIALKERVPYSIRQEGGNIVVDFNVLSLAGIGQAAAAPKGEAVAAPSAGPAVQKSSVNGGRQMTIDVQDADVKAVLRLLAEEGKVSIVSGDDVKGPVTLQMKKVSWEQALDTILEIKGLGRRQVGNVITVMTLDKIKKDEADAQARETLRRKAEDEKKKIEQALLAEKGILRQVSIEARIVEASDNFTRKLGVQWGAGVSGRVGAYPFGTLIGTNSSVTGVRRHRTHKQQSRRELSHGDRRAFHRPDHRRVTGRPGRPACRAGIHDKREAPFSAEGHDDGEHQGVDQTGRGDSLRHTRFPGEPQRELQGGCPETGSDAQDHA